MGYASSYFYHKQCDVNICLMEEKMDNNYLLRVEDLVNNPTPRVPICLCLDISGSMGAPVKNGRSMFSGSTTRIKELQEGVNLFYEEIKSDEVAKYSAEICIVTFNNRATCVMDFANIERQTSIPQFVPAGQTWMGEGVNLALDLLEKRKNEYRDKGVDYYQPWLVLMTDGEANGNRQELERAIQRTISLERQRKLVIFPIGIGDETDMPTLKRFSERRTALKLQGLKFQEFFDWLSKSVSRLSQSIPGEAFSLDQEGIKGWAEL